ncbi:MAG: hypothetical protein ACC726_15690 [Chloroflexota bacterium]
MTSGSPERSAAACVKDAGHHTPEGLPVHDFRGLLTEPGTLTRDRVLLDGAAEEAAVEILAEPTPRQARALEFASVSPLAQ